MWKTAFLSLIRAHRVAAVLLIALATLSSSALAYVAVEQNGVACAPNLLLLPQDSHLFWETFYLAPPSVVKICLTVQFYGNPQGTMNLNPGLDLFFSRATSFGWSDCSYHGTNCGGANVSSSPENETSPFLPIHVVWTINVPIGTMPGEYLLQYGLCRGGGLIGLSIGEFNSTFMRDVPFPFCPGWVYGVEVAFDSYTGMVPVSQNSYPLLSF